MTTIRYLIWDGDQHDVYGDEILDVVENMSISDMLREDINIAEYQYPGEFKNIPELVRFSNYRLMKAMFTNERFFNVACIEE